MTEKRIQIKDIVKNQLPEYVREEYPLVNEFLSQYYISQEFQGAPVDLIQNIDKYIKVDSVTNLVEYTLLGSDISAIDTDIKVDLLNSEIGTEGFPEKYGLISINNELIVYESKTFDGFRNCYRGFSGIISHKNTNVGIASTYKLKSQDQLVFKDSESESHKSGSKIYNLSSLFLKEFLVKLKYQLTPGFENRSFVEKLNEATLIKQIKDFYRSKGTDRSFEILFKSLYGEDVKVIRPKEYLFRPSDAQYKITNDLVVEHISGPIEELPNLTLFQNTYLNIPRAYGPVTEIENIVSNDGKTFYKLKIDGGYNRDPAFDGAIYGRFTVHPKTRSIGRFSSGSTVLDVDSTVGFPSSGEIQVIYEDGTSGTVLYTSKNLTQFLGCSGVISNILDNSIVGINTYANAVTGFGTEIKVRINSIISGVDLPDDTRYYSKGDTASIKTLGFTGKDARSNKWVFNISPTYEVNSFILIDSSDQTYSLNLKNTHILKLGDIIEITDSTGVTKTSEVIDVLSDKDISIRGQGLLNDDLYTIKRKVLKVNATNFTESNFLTANVQNVYGDSNKTLVASASIPYYPNQSLDVTDRSITFSGFFSGSTLKITSLVDHGFYTGDCVYYTPEKTTVSDIDADGNSSTRTVISSSLFDEGIYFIKRVDSNQVKFAKSRSDILFGKYLTLDNPVTVSNNIITPFEFYNKTLESQKLLREISDPIITGIKYETMPGFTGILANGVEILNYKSKDKVTYGPIERVEILSGGSGYDIINPPQLVITDTVGSGATGYCAVSGSLQEIRIVDPGFDYQDVPTIKITGGNGSGAQATANMRTITHEVYFNSELNSGLVSIGSTSSTIGFSTYHKFRNGEEVIYRTFSQKAVGGLSTDASYYASVQSPTTIKLHKNLNDAITGINTITFDSFGVGNHSLESKNSKLVLGSITVTNSGSGYQNKKRTVSSSGISTSLDRITITNHDFSSGEIVRYSTEGSVIGGLTNNTNYYVTKIDEDSFRLSEVGSGSYSQDFYYKTKQYIKLTSKNNDTHTFNYPNIEVEVVGNLGISSEFKAQIQPIFRGEITSIHLSSKGSSYGVEDILNIDRQPLFNIIEGSNAELVPVISNGKITEVLINNVGKNYTCPPDLVISGSGSGAVLTPIIQNKQLVEVKVVSGGSGYQQNNTEIVVIQSGSGANFKAKIKTWTVNNFQKYINNITKDDGFLYPGLNENFGIQYTHLYAPRKLREILYSSDQSGKTLFSNSDLRILNGSEISSTDHSPIIGWSYDGHPIYGPYGYSTRSGGVVTQMKSGYKLSLDSTRPSLQYFPEGFFVEDYKHFSVNDDTVLDENNGRFCVTPEYPNGVYAYFATVDDSSIESSGPFVGYKKPIFPYLIGKNYYSKPNQFNFEISSNQDGIDLNKTDWIRNTFAYNLLEKESTYEYVTLPNDLDQTIDVTGTSPGSIDRIGILTGGDGYKVNDVLVFNNIDINGKTRGNAASAIVSNIGGKFISTISVASSTIYDVEFYPANNKGDYILYNDSPHNFKNFDLVSVSGLSTTSSFIEGTYIAGIETSKLALVGTGTSTVGIETVGITGIVTYISVRGNLSFENIRENDIFTINSERVKILNVDSLSSRLRILRQVDGTVGTSHSITTVLYEDPRKLIIRSGINTEYIYSVNKEFYFDPKDSLGLGTVGTGTTISFSNPGAGLTQVFVPLRSIYLPNHNLNTGDLLTYQTNGGDSILVSSTGLGTTTLSNGSNVYVAKINNDLIGISTVQVGLGSTGFFSGITTSTKNVGLLYFTGIGTGSYHSFKTNYSVITGQISRNIVTVSTAETHGLSNNDEVEVDVNPSISTSITVKYNDYNRKIIINPRYFTASDVNISENTITITNHRFVSGQKVVYTSTSPSTGLVNENIYYIVVVDENNVRLSNTYFNSKDIKPFIVDINSASLGTLSPVNPPIKLYKNSTVTFDLSDSSLSYVYQSTRYPAFKFEIYEDANFKNIFDSSRKTRTFNVQQFGIIGVSADARVTVTVDDSLPKTLYYNLIPVSDGVSPIEKREVSFDDTVNSYNQLEIVNSKYNGVFNVLVPTQSTFTYFLSESPERSSYTFPSILKYNTTSLSSNGPIKEIKITNRGFNYYSLPSISTVSSAKGKGAILEVFGNDIGKIKKTRINNVGFDFPSDYTLRPNVSLPKIIKIDRLSSFNSIGITSLGRGYISTPKLLVFDGKTKNLVPEVDLQYTLGSNEVVIKNNAYGISDVTPIILPIQNSNGVGIRTISYNPANKKVTVGLSTGFSSLSSFPFSVNDKVLIENISVGVGSTGKGFNSENYNYQLFTLTEVDANIGGIGSVTYSLDGYLSESDFPGTFDSFNSAGRIIPEKFFPVFNPVLKKNEFRKGETVKSGSSTGIVEEWDSTTNYLKISTKDLFFVGNKIEGESSKTQGIASSITEFDCYASLDSTSKFENGWVLNAGFLNDELQKIQDSLYYQNFSYTLKSKVDFDTWNDAVSTLNHTVGFKKFSDLQIESKVSENTNTSLSVGISTQNTGVDVIVDMVGYGNLNCVYDFDLARENSIKLGSRVLSNEISFNNRILTDYFESFGNRVLSIDDISGQFNSNPRPTKFSEVHRFDLRSIRAQKYFTYIKDRRYTGHRQAMLLTLIHDDSVGYLNQYGRVETSYDMGSFDFAIDGSEGVLQYYPTNFSINDYDIATISVNLKDDMVGVGTTSISSVVLIDTSNIQVSSSSTVTIVSFATTYTSAKIFVEFNGGDGEYELDEINVIHDGSNIEFIEYGQLTTGSVSEYSTSGYGTYYPYISGSNLNIDFISNPGIGTSTTINTIKVAIADTATVGIGTLDMKHARLTARTTSISSSTSPSPSVLLDYSGEYSAAYCLVQVSDLTNNRHQLSEVVMINDDETADAYITEFGNLETHSGLGTIGASVSGIGQTTQLIFTPIPNIETQVKVYANILRIQDDLKDIIDLNNGTIETGYGVYYGTDRDLRRSFDLTHKTYPIFERYFSGFSTSIINIVDDTIEIPNHFFVTGEKVTYNYAGAGTTQAIGIGTTAISGIGLTDKLPSELYIVKVNDNKVKVAVSATDALKSVPNTLDITSVGIGTSHRFIAHNQNSKVIVALDNIIQSPIVSTSQTTTLSKNLFTTEDILYFSGITSFFGGDLIRIGEEIMRVDSVGVGSTNAVKVRRPWLGTVIAGYSTGSLVTKVTGTYNITNSNINFVEAPYGNIPLSSTTNPPDERDWVGISTGSKFQGRSFMRSGITNSSNESYYKNYVFNDISTGFNGSNRTFTLNSDSSNVSGISNENAVILINDVFQGPGTNLDYTLLESSGITSVRFTGTATSVSYDVNTSNLPVGGTILSVGSTEGFGYQPLVSAGGTAIVSGLGTISSVSIANSGSGYRIGSQIVRVGVQTSDNNDFYIHFIGTAVVSNGNIIGVAITNPGIGYTTSNPPKVIIDDPLSYSDIPLVYSSSSVAGVGTGAKISIVVGQGSSVIDFEINNYGYGYREGEILTVPIGGFTGIQTTSQFKEFQLTIDKTFSDKFTGWSIGELQPFDDISDLFDGETTTFPLKVSGNLISIKSAKGSNINVQDLLLVFVNDILQVPGEGYVFEGGTTITFTEAPKGPSLGIPGTNDKCKILFYKGSGSVDVIERNILETVKIGDKLILGYDSSIGQSPILQEEERTVTSILSTDIVETNPYFGPGNTENESLARTITWCRQTEDKIIDEQMITKDRMSYEPSINPVAYLITSVGIGSTVVYVDTLRPFFNQLNESSTSLEFQKQITFISQDSKVGASATAIVSIAGTISSVVISDGGFGYSSSPNVTFENPVGLGTTYRASGISSISSGIVTFVSIVDTGTGYSQKNPPLVFIEPPSFITETNTVSQYQGDFGTIIGVSTITVGVASTGIVFDLMIEKDSFLRDPAIAGVTTISGIQTGYYFTVFDSNIGFGVTSLDESGQIIGIGSTCLDNVYKVASVSIAQTGAPGLGVTYVAKVVVSVSDYNNLTGIGHSSFFGKYSWGRIDLISRTKDIQYNAYTQLGYSGISTGTIVKRSNPLKYFNYIP